MHELSIANSLVEIATEHATASDADRVSAINIQIGELSCVHQDALMFSFELVTKGTIIEGATLNIKTIPVKIYCSRCEEETSLPGIQKFRCPKCNTPSADVRHGRELEIVSIEVTDREASHAASPASSR